MSDDPAHTICDVVTECQAIVEDTKGGKHTKEQAFDKIAAELSRHGLINAMYQVGYFPESTPPADGH